MPQIINSIGLGCVVIGFVLIWKYGLPLRSPGGVHGLDNDAAELKKKYQKRSKVGFMLFLIGFGLQVLSSYLE